MKCFWLRRPSASRPSFQVDPPAHSFACQIIERKTKNKRRRNRFRKRKPLDQWEEKKGIIDCSFHSWFVYSFDPVKEKRGKEAESMWICTFSNWTTTIINRKKENFAVSSDDGKLFICLVIIIAALRRRPHVPTLYRRLRTRNNRESISTSMIASTTST